MYNVSHVRKEKCLLALNADIVGVVTGKKKKRS
jgi:hypothetical protein